MKFLLVGTITHSFATYKDGVKERFSGGVMDGGRTATKLGINTTCITIGSDEIEPGIQELKLLGIKMYRAHRATSNNFSNDYRQGKRKMYMRSFIDEPLIPSDFAFMTEEFDCIILAPLFHEISYKILSLFTKKQLVLLDPQGFTRKLGKINSDGLFPVVQSHWKSYKEFPGKISVLKLSNEDLEGIRFPKDIETEEEKCKHLASLGFPLVILTRGSQSTIVIGEKLKATYIPTYKVTVIDPAGAGETFNMGFMYKFLKTRDPMKAVKFGNACAALKIAGKKFDVETLETYILTNP